MIKMSAAVTRIIAISNNYNDKNILVLLIPRDKMSHG